MLGKALILALTASGIEASFLNTRATCACSFKLTTTGAVSYPVGQTSNGQAQASPNYSQSQFCLNGNTLSDSQGRGCFFTPPTTVLQCDIGQVPVPSFAIDCNGIVSYNGSSTFYECPSGTGNIVNIYLQPVTGVTCGKIGLTADGCRTSCPSSSSSRPSSSTSSTLSTRSYTSPVSVTTISTTSATCPRPSTAVITVTTSQLSTTTLTTTSTPAYTVLTMTCPVAPSPQTVTVTTTRSASTLPPSTVTATVTATSTTTVCPASPSSTTSSRPALSTTSLSLASSSTTPSTSSRPATTSTSTSSRPTTTSTSSSMRPTTTTTSSSTRSSSTTVSPPTSSCPAVLGSNFEYPHLIVPVNSSSPNTAYGTSYFGQLSTTVSSLFNFDIPLADAGKQCTLLFTFPSQSQLQTSSYTITGSGSVAIDLLKAPAMQQTTYANQPAVSQRVGSFTPAPGNAYTIYKFACPTGTTVSYRLSTTGGNLGFRYFQDYNPCPIGLYVTVS